MIHRKTFYFNDLRVCCYVLWDETREAIIVDPGCYTDREKARLADFVEKESLVPVKLVNTHGHFDHIMGNRFVVGKWGIRTYIHPDDVPQLMRSKDYCSMFGYEIDTPPYETEPLEEGVPLTFGNSFLKVFHTPGHTRGGVCLYSEDSSFILTGDSLFAGSIGRTDLPGGDYDQLADSLANKILKVSPDTVVLPGHGNETTIGYEISTNPFLADMV